MNFEDLVFFLVRYIDTLSDMLFGHQMRSAFISKVSTPPPIDVSPQLKNSQLPIESYDLSIQRTLSDVHKKPVCPENCSMYEVIGNKRYMMN